MATNNPKIREAIDRAKAAVVATHKFERGLTDLIAQLEAEHKGNVERMVGETMPRLYEEFGNALDAFGHDVADACIELGIGEPRPIRTRDRNREEAAQLKEIRRSKKRLLAAEREKLDAIAAKVPDLGKIEGGGEDETEEVNEKIGGLGLKELTEEQRKVAAAAEAKGGEGEADENADPFG